jgi:2-(1,2-epoxy-1,2-dihydrophenyl)acetyl-CoA isomerase
MSIKLDTEAGVATITINRPERKNAFTIAMRYEFCEFLEKIALDPDVRAVIITGAGDCFCSGMDVTEMGTNDVVGARYRLQLLHRMARAVAKLDKPVIAAVRGVAVGAGWSLVLGCDIVIAGESARFAQVFKNIALAPDAGSVYYLSRLIGPARAKELVFSGRWVKAEEAQQLGLVHRVVPDEQLMDNARELAREYASSASLALGFAKRMFEVAATSNLEQFLDYEIQAQAVLSQSYDHKEGTDAFKEKRKAEFKGR